MKDTLVYVEQIEIQNSSVWLSLLLNINDWLNLETKLNLGINAIICFEIKRCLEKNCSLLLLQERVYLICPKKKKKKNSTNM